MSLRTRCRLARATAALRAVAATHRRVNDRLEFFLKFPNLRGRPLALGSGDDALRRSRELLTPKGDSSR